MPSTGFWNRLSHAILVLLSLAWCHVYAYQSGAPKTACSRMVPGHGAREQTSSPIFKVKALQSSVAAGEQITGDTPFKGYFIRVKQGSEFVNGGRFIRITDSRLRCNDQGITHSVASTRTNVRHTWVAPPTLDNTTDLVFVATVVKEFRTFWTQIQSNAVQVMARDGALTSPVPPNNLPGNKATSSDAKADQKSSSTSNTGSENVSEEGGVVDNGGNGAPTPTPTPWQVGLLLPVVLCTIRGQLLH